MNVIRILENHYAMRDALCAMRLSNKETWV